MKAFDKNRYTEMTVICCSLSSSTQQSSHALSATVFAKADFSLRVGESYKLAKFYLKTAASAKKKTW